MTPKFLSLDVGVVRVSHQTPNKPVKTVVTLRNRSMIMIMGDLRHIAKQLNALVTHMSGSIGSKRGSCAKIGCSFVLALCFV